MNEDKDSQKKKKEEHSEYSLSLVGEYNEAEKEKVEKMLEE